jgi:hypothetical protein
MSDVNVSFGAIDASVAAAARRLAADLSMMEKAGARAGNTTQLMGKSMQMFTRSMVGPLAGLAKFGPYGVAIAALGGAWMAAAKGAEAYAKIDKQAAQEMEVTRLRAQGLWETLGKMSRDSFGVNILSPIAALEQGLASAVGVDPEVQRLHFEQMNKEAQLALDLSLARDESERAFLKTLHEETMEFEKQKMHRLAMQKAGLITERSRASLDRTAGEGHRARVDFLFRNENDRIGKEMRDRQKADREAREAFQDHTFEIFKKTDAERKSLEYTIAEANIDTLSAQGKEKQAKMEQVRLETVQKIADIKSKEFATDAEKQRAIEAVQRAEAAQLRQLDAKADKIRTPFTGSQVIMPGFASAGLSRQVFGPDGFGASSGDRSLRALGEVKKTGEETVAVLQRIETKISTLGTLGP